MEEILRELEALSYERRKHSEDTVEDILYVTNIVEPKEGLLNKKMPNGFKVLWLEDRLMYCILPIFSWDRYNQAI
jgi:hypothetical protein